MNQSSTTSVPEAPASGAGHTPGPWRIQAIKPIDPTVFRIYGLDKLSERTPLLADVWGSEANARLIAFAPELLAFARKMMDYSNDAQYAREASALVAKAEGR